MKDKNRYIKKALTLTWPHLSRQLMSVFKNSFFHEIQHIIEGMRRRKRVTFSLKLFLLGKPMRVKTECCALF